MSTPFTMVPLPESKLENLIPLLRERWEELREKRPLIKDKLHHTLKEGYGSGMFDCYVNDVENPTHFVALMFIDDFWDNEPTVLVQAVFISKTYRGNQQNSAVIHALVKGYATIKRASRIVAGVSCDDSGTPVSKFWERAGFSKTQISYTLTL